MSLKIESPGMLATLQDLGRAGYQKYGVVVGGGMDAVALRLANILVGNEEGKAVMEITLHGPKIRFIESKLIAITGADLSARLDGEPVPMWRPLYVEKDSLLSFGKPVMGRFAYLAVAGGFDVPKVLDSYSTYLQAGIGGWKGRALQKDDLIGCNKPTIVGGKILENIRKRNYKQAKWYPALPLIPKYYENPLLKVIKGPEYDWFSAESKKKLWEEDFIVSRQSSRMGYQLEEPLLSLRNKSEILSTAVTFGTIQVPAGGKPIILGADRQTIGGYPRIAQVISTDLPNFVQAQDGQAICFQEVSIEEAQQRFCQQEINMESLKRAIYLKASY